MNFFERELRKLFENSEFLSDVRFTGRVCMARLTDAVTVKLEFVTLGTQEHYEGIKATVLNRNEGSIDATVFRFEDIWGRKKVPDHPTFKHGACPYIWKEDKEQAWYAYKPTPRDFEAVTETLENYLEMFQEPVQRQGLTQQFR
jgi:hypothetical protein